MGPLLHGWDFKDGSSGFLLIIPGRMQADIIIKLWPNCKPGFLFMLFVFSWTTWTVAKPEAWLPWPPPGAQQSQDSSPPPPPSYLWGFVLHSQQTVPPSHFQSRQCPGRLEARSEAHSALSLKPKQDYLFNFPNTLMKTKFQPKDTSLDPNSSLTIASFPRPPLE